MQSRHGTYCKRASMPTWRFLKPLKRHMRSRHAHRCYRTQKKVQGNPYVPLSIQIDIFLYPTGRKSRATASGLHIGNEILGSPAEHITVSTWTATLGHILISQSPLLFSPLSGSLKWKCLSFSVPLSLSANRKSSAITLSGEGVITVSWLGPHMSGLLCVTRRYF